jgi:Zn finger protein HypA/HybF involved in hydrogenase expression
MKKENVNTDYSCGNCGWYGNNEDCISDECPKCGSVQVGMITEEDFREGNALFGKLWYGKEILINN